MRLIDADALKKEIAKRTPHFVQRIALTPCFEAIRDAPTIDAMSCEGCIHEGKWENEYENGYSSPCTKCKRRALDNWERQEVQDEID